MGCCDSSIGPTAQGESLIPHPLPAAAQQAEIHGEFANIDVLIHDDVPLEVLDIVTSIAGSFQHLAAKGKPPVDPR